MYVAKSNWVMTNTKNGIVVEVPAFGDEPERWLANQT
jgi:hypothetical protein